MWCTLYVLPQIWIQGVEIRRFGWPFLLIATVEPSTREQWSRYDSPTRPKCKALHPVSRVTTCKDSNNSVCRNLSHVWAVRRLWEIKEAKHRIVELTTSLIYTALTSKILFVVPRDSLLKTDEKLHNWVSHLFLTSISLMERRQVEAPELKMWRSESPDIYGRRTVLLTDNVDVPLCDMMTMSAYWCNGHSIAYYLEYSKSFTLLLSLYLRCSSFLF
jgi:hypothetical protein